MASPTAHVPERPKIEQIVLEFFAKSLHIILESRIPALCSQSHCGEDESVGSSASSSSTGPKTRDRWFNLALGDCATALENFEPWRRSFSEPMVVDVLLVQPKAAGGSMPPPRGAPSGQQWPKGSSPSRGNTPLSWSTGEGNSLQGAFSGSVLERWIVQFERRKSSSVGSGLGLKGTRGSKGGMGLGEVRRGSNTSMGLGEVPEMRGSSRGSGSGSGSGVQGGIAFQERDVGEAAARGGNVGLPLQLPAHVTEVPAVYKRTVIMLRSLYCRTRLLPAYRLFRLANTSSHSRSFDLTYRVLSSAPPLSEYEEMDMTSYSFTPVETAYGRMRLSVAYRHTTAVTALEVIPPILPRIISDYVGSPTTDPLKRFPGEPHSMFSSGISGSRGVHVVSVPSSVQNSPSGPNLGRRHSWSGGVDQMQPTLQPPSSPSYRVSRSPSPSYPFDGNPSPPYPPSPYSPYSRKHPSSDHSSSPRSSPSLSSAGTQPTHLYRQVGLSQPISIENRLSPPFSPSPSPSPPTSYSQEGIASKGPAWSGSAPVSIPKPALSRGPKLLTGELYQYSRNPLPPPSPRSRKSEALLRTSSGSPRFFTGQVLTSSGSPLNGKVTQPSTSLESPLQIPMSRVDHVQQALRNERTGPLFGLENLFRGPSQATLPRVSSKPLLHDDADDEDFSCPFAVDDDEAEEQRGSRIDSFRIRGKAPESSDSSGQGISQQRSQDAAVGALVRMLKSAPPLRQSIHQSALTLDLSSTSLEATTSELMSGSPPYPVIRNRTGELQTATLQPGSGVSSTYHTKTTTDALQELRGYKDMRDVLLSQSGEVIGRSKRNGRLGASDNG